LAADFKYVGSKKSSKYHYPTCKWAQKIYPQNLITFKSAKDAQAAGYVPCKVCKPPLTD
jgi:micrococcal nuclease